MTTLCASDLSFGERSNVVDLSQRKRLEPSERARELAIREAVIDYCRSIGIVGLQAEACVDAARAEKAFGANAFKAQAAGKAMADRLANNQRVLRTRFGTRPDDAA
jgi:hypothetical protein